MSEKNVIQCPCCLSSNTPFFLCEAGKDRQYKQYQCSQCGYQFTWPCPSSEEIDRYYASESYYKAAENGADPGDYIDYDSQIKDTLVFFRNLLKQLNLPEKSAMLDVGCAKGRYMELAKKEFGFKCSGVELSDYARNYVQEHYHGIFPVWKSLEMMPVQKKAFDLIILFDVIEHVNSPWDIFLQLFRRGCISETTRILITTPNCTHERAVKNPGAWEYRYPPAHLSFCAPETFQKIGEKLLFKNINISGHSQKEISDSWLQNPLQKTYAGYDGLICSFSGTSLTEIPPQEFPASLEELNRSEKYVSLLPSFVFEKKSSPLNPEFEKFVSDFCGSLTVQGNSLKSQNQDLMQKYSSLEEGWKAEHQQNLEQAKKHDELLQKYSSLKEGWEVEHQQNLEQAKKHDELLQKYSSLEEGWKAEHQRNLEQAKKHDELLQKYSSLKEGWKAEHQQNLEQAKKRAVLEKELSAENEKYVLLKEMYEKAVTDNSNLCAENAMINGRRYDMWLEIKKMHSISEQHLSNISLLENKVQQLIPYKDHLEKQVYDLASQRDQLDAKLKELLPYKDHLEKQVRELNSQRDRMKNQLCELNSQRDQMENQLRELVPYKDHLENQVREFSEKLNEVYHSNSYRIGRLITWPVRKCQAFINGIRNKLKEWQDIKAEFGSEYMRKCVFRKLTGRSEYFYYDIISSIGATCEVSFNFERYHHFVDSYPLVWAFIHSLKTLPAVIKDPMCLSGDRPFLHNHSTNMVRYENVNISFHCQNHAEYLLDADGKVDEAKAQAERDELKSRLTYLSGKWKKVLEDPDKKVLLVLSPFEDQSSTEDILAINEAIKKYPEVDLLTVLTGKEEGISASALQKKGIFVRYITKHPPHDKVTDLESTDVVGWNRIFHEFRPLQKKISNKVYKYEH